jgi:hypothetical protein
MGRSRLRCSPEMSGNVHGLEMRFKFNAQIFSHGRERPARMAGEDSRSGRGIPAEARAKPGSTADLSAMGSTDPDGQTLSYEWFIYPEAGTYTGQVRVEGARSAEARVAVPADAAGKEVHVILTV